MNDLSNSQPLIPEEELTKFINIVSHDVRAPIRHINEFYTLFMNSLNIELSDEQNELKSYLEDSISLANTQMNSLLDYSRLNTRKSHLKEVNITRFFNDILEELTPTEDSVAVNIASSLSKTNILCYERCLYIACIEVLKNAIIFTPKDKEPCVSVKANKEDKNIVIIVEDKGIGISKKQIPEAFEPFRRLNHRAQYPGIGMGLALAKKAIEKIEGNITLHSTPNEGSRVKMVVPINITG